MDLKQSNNKLIQEATIAGVSEQDIKKLQAKCAASAATMKQEQEAEDQKLALAKNNKPVSLFKKHGKWFASFYIPNLVKSPASNYSLIRATVNATTSYRRFLRKKTLKL